ncbi:MULTISPECIES: hypothetical protein [unclassified Proteiniphilum]|jgi:hypothetical protein|uniref:hypothetical protein n=1 Tax=unclassified Proteiniphilum TaxID=2622718 RepID=UPI00257CB110|nr:MULTISPECIES: hypothetical protein [unclassified Proteiniphilum]
MGEKLSCPSTKIFKRKVSGDVFLFPWSHCIEEGVDCLDTYTLFVQNLEENLLQDHVHPSLVGYILVVLFLYNYLNIKEIRN